MLSVISCQLSVISYQLSVVSCQSSIISCQLSVISYQLSVICYLFLFLLPTPYSLLPTSFLSSLLSPLSSLFSLLFFRPRLGGGYCSAPMVDQIFNFFGFHQRFKFTFRFPLVFQVINVFPETCCKPSQISSTKCCCFSNSWSNNPCTNYIALELHQEIINRCTSINAKFFDGNSGISFHSLKYFQRLISDTFKRSSCNMGSSGATGYAYHSSPCMLIPMWRAETGKSRNKVNTAIIAYFH